MGFAMGTGTSRLAHRVQRDGDHVARRPDRHPLRWRGQHFPAPRSGDRAERRSDRKTICAVLDALRASARRWPENVEVVGEFLHDPRRSRERLYGPRDPLRSDTGELPDPVEFYLVWIEISAGMT